jgi:peptidoglycan hydrolase-like protein with peptidoglycan-binding domain
MGWATLRRGDVGSDTLALQQWLNANRKTGLDTDGAFGPKTEAAVTSFQQAAGIGVDGIAGPETQTAMKAWKPNSSKPPADPNAPAFPLAKGGWYGAGGTLKGAGLKDWQTKMAKRGWTIGADGVYGPQTKSVVRAFQAEKGLVIDGLIGAKTWAAAWTAPIT